MSVLKKQGVRLERAEEALKRQGEAMRRNEKETELQGKALKMVMPATAVAICLGGATGVMLSEMFLT